MTAKGSEEYKQRRREYMRGYLEKNREELNEKRRQYRRDNPEVVRAKARAKFKNNRDRITAQMRARWQVRKDDLNAKRRSLKYGLPHEIYLEMVTAQKGRCAICGEKRKLCVDHNHQTDAVRELLCSPCNTAIGLFKEDAARMQTAIDYLAKHGGAQ